MKLITVDTTTGNQITLIKEHITAIEASYGSEFCRVYTLGGTEHLIQVSFVEMHKLMLGQSPTAQSGTTRQI